MKAHVADTPVRLVADVFASSGRAYDEPPAQYVVQFCRECEELLYCGTGSGYCPGSLVDQSYDSITPVVTSRPCQEDL